ncbi:MAG: ATP12 family protein [Pseudomonadota bacterium]
MREILEDAEAAIDAGKVGPGKSNRDRDKPVFPKRFYEKVGVSTYNNEYIVELDGKGIRTPGAQRLSLPTEVSAHLVRDEWDAIETEINPLKMPITRIANTAIDGVATQIQAVMEDIIRYAGTDLLCYRADTPEGLVAKQREYWDSALDWAGESMQAHFEIVTGIMHISQPKLAIDALGTKLKAYNDPFRLACIHVLTTLSGSAILALAVAEKHMDAHSAWTAAHVDEDWNISQWGEDYEAAQRRQQRWGDFEAAYNFIQSLD